MNKLTSIVKKLSSWEKTQIINLYKQDGKRESTLRLKLLNLILDNPNIGAKEASLKIYKKPPDAAFSNLKRRLTEDIIDVLIIQSSQTLFTASRAKAKHDCRKKILAAEILKSRGEQETAYKILEATLKTAEKFELFMEATSIRLTLADYKGPREGFNTLESYFKDIKQDILSLNQLVMVEEIRLRISLTNKFKISKEKNILSTLENQIAKLHSIKSDKELIQFSYYHALVFYHYENKDFDAYLEAIQNYTKLVLPGQILHTKSNLAWAYASTMEVYLNLAQYDKSIEFGKKALALLSKNFSNRVFVLRYVFAAYFNAKNYDKANETIEDAFQERLVKSNELEKARFSFYAACVAFQKENMELAMANLYKALKIVNKDGSGWLIGYKILEMMVSIKDKNSYLLSTHLDNFLKLLNNHKEAQTERARLIYKILRTYNKFNFNKKETLAKINNELSLLKEGKDQYYWDPVSYEIIRFDKWFEEL